MSIRNFTINAVTEILCFKTYEKIMKIMIVEEDTR